MSPLRLDVSKGTGQYLAIRIKRLIVALGWCKHGNFPARAGDWLGLGDRLGDI